MLLPDVCTAPCDQHIKDIGNYTKLCWCHITLSLFQKLQSSPKEAFCVDRHTFDAQIQGSDSLKVKEVSLKWALV